jgi:hypothetical protein
MVQNLKHYLQKIRQRTSRWMFLLPILSTLWGITSGITVSRDYDKSPQLIGYLAALVLVFFLLRIWFENDPKDLNDLPERASGTSLTRRKKIHASLRKRPRWIEVPAMQVTQYCAQYIVTFSLPLLYDAQAWPAFCVALLLAATTLWDPWWVSLVKHPWYRSVIRIVSTILAVGFVYPVVFPTSLYWYQTLVGVLALLVGLPWQLLRRGRASRKQKAFEGRRLFFSFLENWGPALGVIFITTSQWVIGQHDWFPVLSVWVKSPAMGIGIDQRALKEPMVSTISRLKLEEALGSPDGLCCLTPVKGPSGMASPIVHEWRVDGVVADRIILPAVLGTGEHPREFRTFSCKHHLPKVSEAQNISCIAYLEGRHLLSEVQLKVE